MWTRKFARAFAGVIICAGIIAIGLGTGSTIQQALEPKQATFLVDDSTLSLGRVSIQQEATREVRIENVGNADLELRITKISCGCTSAELDREVIAPGDYGILTFTITTPEFPGSFSSDIFFETSDPVLPEARVTIHGEATAAIDIEPRTINFGAIDHSKLPASKWATLKVPADSSLDPQTIAVSSTVPYVVPELVREEQEISLRIELGAEAPYGVFREVVSITSEAGSDHTLRLPVVGEHRGEFGANPNTLFFNNSKIGERRSISTRINIPENTRVQGVKLVRGRLEDHLELEYVKDDDGSTILIATITPPDVRDTLGDIISVELVIEESQESLEIHIPVIVTISRGVN